MAKWGASVLGGAADPEFVKARIDCVEKGSILGSALTRWREADDSLDVLASPAELMAQTESIILTQSFFDSDVTGGDWIGLRSIRSVARSVATRS